MLDQKGENNYSYKHGLYKTKLYRVWASIKKRCNCKTHYSYRMYGGRGITMQESWLNDPKAFCDYINSELGEKPTPKHSLDRINNDFGYCEGNLRWATPQQQTDNRRDKWKAKIYIDPKGNRGTAKELSALHGILASTIRQKVRRGVSGWSIE